MGFRDQLTRFDRTKINPAIALRNTLGLTLVLSAGVASGATHFGIYASLGALNTAFSDGGDPYFLRARRMLAAAAITAVAIVAGSTAGWHPFGATVLIGLWALGAGLLVVISSAGADIGLLSLVMVLVFVGQPTPLDDALMAGLFAAVGGLVQTSLSVALWPFRRYEPERRVIAALYRDLSTMAASPIKTSEAPFASGRANEAQAVVRALGRTHTVQGDRYVSLVSQAERIRLSLIKLRGAPFLPEVASITNAIARILDGEQLSVDPGWLAAVTHDGLAGQLRAAYELATSSTPAGREAFERRQLERPWRMRVESTLSVLRANFSLRSSAMRHALRLSVAVLAGEALAHAAGGRRSYWLPMTAAIVLKPEFTVTFSRGVLRVLGTLAGLAGATVLFHLVTATAALEVALICVIVFLLRCFGPANYGLLTATLTAYIVLLFALSGQPPAEVIQERGWNTLLGGALACTIYGIWPTWERTQIKETIANMLDSYRLYFRAVHDRTPDLERRRLEGRLARSNAEAAVDRYAVEPGAQPEVVTLLSQMMASTHRVIHAMMAIEAGLTEASPAFVAFAHKVEITLHSLAAALRGSRVNFETLPDLRSAYNDVANSGFELLPELDRLTNSVNTLSEQVGRFCMVTPATSGRGRAPSARQAFL